VLAVLLEDVEVELEPESLLFVSEAFVELSDFVFESEDALFEESDVLLPSESGFFAPLLPLP
jgi:hypothetical protein